MRRSLFSLLGALALFLLLSVYSAPVRAGAAAGLTLWGELLVPSLLPFFVCAGLLMRLGLPEALGAVLSPVLGRALGTGAVGCSLFVLGLSGGYPLGAVTAAEMVKEGRLSQKEAERLLIFCDNSGPAFAVGALGAGVFGSALWGLALWGVHALCALLLGCLVRGKEYPESPRRVALPAPAFGAALNASVQSALEALLRIGAFVVFFSALLGLLGRFGFPEEAAEAMAAVFGGNAAFYRAALTGCLELSGGVGALSALPTTPGALALAEGLMSFGGLCVHFQSAAAAREAGLSARGRLWGKLLHGVLSAVCMYLVASALLR